MFNNGTVTVQQQPESIFTPSKRYYLMGLATIMVVFYHFYLKTSFLGGASSIFRFLFQNGDCGVNLFFLLSSYGCCYSFSKNNLLQFYQKRFRRLYPIYLLFLIYPHLLANESLLVSLSDALLGITGLGIFFNSQSWYLEALTIVYITFPLLYYSMGYVSKFNVLSIVALFVLPVLLCIWIEYYYTQLFVGRIPTILLGILIYLYEQREERKKLFLILGLFALCSLTNLYHASYLFIPATSIMLVAGQKQYLPFIKLFEFMGKYSLEIYMGHVMAISFIGKYFSWSTNIWLVLLLFIVLSTLNAIILHYLQKYCWRIMPKI